MTQEAWRPSEQPVAWIVEWPDDRVRSAGSVIVRHKPGDLPGNTSTALFTASQLAAEVERAVASERERCAKLCADGIGSGPENGCCQTSYVWDDAQDACAAAIRSSAPRANGGEG